MIPAVPCLFAEMAGSYACSGAEQGGSGMRIIRAEIKTLAL
jgi:hypothetical protein